MLLRPLMCLMLRWFSATSDALLVLLLRSLYFCCCFSFCFCSCSSCFLLPLLLLCRMMREKTGARTFKYDTYTAMVTAPDSASSFWISAPPPLDSPFFLSFLSSSPLSASSSLSSSSPPLTALPFAPLRAAAGVLRAPSAGDAPLLPPPPPRPPPTSPPPPPAAPLLVAPSSAAAAAPAAAAASAAARCSSTRAAWH